MIEVILSYIYLWPSVSLLMIFSTVILFFLNTALAVTICFIYAMSSEQMIDSLFQNILEFVRTHFKDIIKKLENNLKETFEIKVHHSLPEKTINVWHPHELLSITPSIHNVFKLTSSEYKPTRLVIIDIIFMIPFVRDLMKFVKMVPSDYFSIKKVAEQQSVSIVLGGAKEMVTTENDKYKLYIKNRKGIFKIALETGTPLVPIITYNESKLFPWYKNDIINDFNSMLYSLFHISIPVPTFTSVYNWFSILHHPLKKITSHVGQAVMVEKIENPTESDIRRIRKKYIKNLRVLFNSTNPGNYILEIT
jgi:hypothetical protein